MTRGKIWRGERESGGEGEREKNLEGAKRGNGENSCVGVSGNRGKALTQKTAEKIKSSLAQLVASKFGERRRKTLKCKDKQEAEGKQVKVIVQAYELVGESYSTTSQNVSFIEPPVRSSQC